jgi:enamine deaminase RidA (YjgF/YER057c/UK114 family)
VEEIMIENASKSPAGFPQRLQVRRRGFMIGGAAALGGLAAAPFLPATARAAGRIDARLQELGVTLPKVPPPVANYVPYVVNGNSAHIAGQLAFKDGELMHPGKVPTDVSLEEAQAAAKQCVINLIAALEMACEGDLDRVQRCVQLQGFVASADDFHNQSKVMNGASDFMVEVFGEAGRHTRVSVGTNALPLNASVEVAGVFAIS